MSQTCPPNEQHAVLSVLCECKIGVTLETISECKYTESQPETEKRNELDPKDINELTLLNKNGADVCDPSLRHLAYEELRIALSRAVCQVGQDDITTRPMLSDLVIAEKTHLEPTIHDSSIPSRHFV